MDSAFWRGKTVLLTGATGFLGGWLCRTLLGHEANVVAIVRNRREESQFFASGLDRSVQVHFGDAADASLVAHACAGRNIDAIFHLTSLVDVTAALDDPVRACHDSIDTTLNILEFARRAAPDAVTIVCSTDKVYGKQPSPFHEEMALLPVHPYEIAKCTQDQLAQAYAAAYGMNIGITRCANFFGGYDLHFERIIPHTIRQLSANGTIALRSDGKLTRDFLYVEEAVNVHLMLAETLATNPSLAGQPFNFSHEVEFNTLELIHLIADMMGTTANIEINDTARNEIPRISLSTRKARTILGWNPAFGFEDGLRRTISWYFERYGT